MAPIVEAYKEYKENKQNIEDSLAMLQEESDEELRELAKEELAESKEKVEELEQKLKILLLPKDPNDDKNVIVEIRAVPVEMRQHCLQQKFTVCMFIMQRANAGKLKPWMWRKSVSAV